MIAYSKNALCSLAVQSPKPKMRSCKVIDVRGNSKTKEVLATEKYENDWILNAQMSNTAAMIMGNARFRLAEPRMWDGFT